MLSRLLPLEREGTQVDTGIMNPLIRFWFTLRRDVISTYVLSPEIASLGSIRWIGARDYEFITPADCQTRVIASFSRDDRIEKWKADAPFYVGSGTRPL